MYCQIKLNFQFWKNSTFFWKIIYPGVTSKSDILIHLSQFYCFYSRHQKSNLIFFSQIIQKFRPNDFILFWRCNIYIIYGFEPPEKSV